MKTNINPSHYISIDGYKISSNDVITLISESPEEDHILFFLANVAKLEGVALAEYMGHITNDERKRNITD